MLKTMGVGSSTGGLAVECMDCAIQMNLVQTLA